MDGGEWRTEMCERRRGAAVYLGEKGQKSLTALNEALQREKNIITFINFLRVTFCRRINRVADSYPTRLKRLKKGPFTVAVYLEN